MKKLLLCFMMLFAIACNPVETNEPIDDTKTETSEGITGGLEDPIENPEQEW